MSWQTSRVPEKLRTAAKASGLAPKAFRDRYGYLANG